MNEYKTVPFVLKQSGSEAVLQGIIEGFAAVTGVVDSGDDIIEAGAFTKTIAENGGRIKLGWLHREPFGVTTYIAEVDRDSLPPAILERAPMATGGLFVRGRVDKTAEDEDRLRRIVSGSVDELSIGYEAVKVGFERDGDRYIRRLKEVKLYEWSPVWIAMNPAALITGVKGAQDEAPPFSLSLDLHQLAALMDGAAREVKAGRRLSASTRAKVNSAVDALRQALEALDSLAEAADEPAKGHSSLPTDIELELLISEFKLCVALANLDH